uniref:Uncharacterized protein n=1 Tax=Arundo donax TaxID=35708 RepID=A0A0A9FRD9_ARUDO
MYMLGRPLFVHGPGLLLLHLPDISLFVWKVWQHVC